MSNSTALHLTGATQLHPYRDQLADLYESVDLPATARLGPLSTWWRHHRESAPWAVLIRRDDRVVAAALLMRTMRGGINEVELIGEHNVPSRLPAVDLAAADELARALRAGLTAHRMPWFLTLNGLEEDDPVAASILARWPLAERCHSYDSPRISFTRGPGLSNYVSRNTRSAVAKARNRIKRDGLAFAMDWHDEPDAVESVVPEIVQLYRERSEQANQSVGLLEDPEYRAYFTDMLRAYAHSGQATLLTVRLNDALASYAMCLSDRRVLFVYSNRMSPQWLRYSPGTIANAEVVRAAHDGGGIDAVDWGGGIQRYKLSGHAVLHPHFDLKASSSRLAHRTHYGLRRVAHTRTRARNAATKPVRLLRDRSNAD